MEIKVSVVIPVYNTEKFLKQCLDSVCNQTYKNIEILCIYKESKDNSYNILNEYKLLDKRIKIINQKEGKLGEARNIGIKQSKGEFIFFLDSDDWIKENALEKLIKKIEDDNADIVMFPFYSFDNKNKKILKNKWGSSININKKKITKPFNAMDLLPEEFISPNSIVVAWNKLYRTKFLKDNKILFPKNLRYEDNPFYYTAILKAKKISVLNQKLLYYRINRENSLQDSTYDDISSLDIIDIFEIIDEVLKINNVPQNFYQSFRKYIISEYKWRFEVIKKIRLNFVNIIEITTPSFFNEFLNSVGWKSDSQIKPHNEYLKPKISIIIPVYNVEKYIEDCILSIVNQSLKELEIIIIDDMGKDNSIFIAQNYAYYDKRIKIIYNNENLGAGYSRNEGLKNAKGDYIIFMDPDDLFPNDKILEKIYKECIKNKANLLCGNIGVINESYEFNDDILKYTGFNTTENRLYNLSEYNTHPSWGFTRFSYKREFLNDNNLNFPEYRNYEDPLFLVNTLLKAQNFYGINDIVYLYRQVPKKQKMDYKKINDTLDSETQILDLYLQNKLYNQYALEYNNLINFIINYIKPYIKDKQINYKEITNRVNNLLLNADKKILKSHNKKTYNSIKEIKKASICQRIINKVKRLIIKIYKIFKKGSV